MIRTTALFFLLVETVAWLAIGGAIMAEDAAPETSGMVIGLPAPARDGGAALERTLQRRRSVRGFAEQPLTLAEISQLLWAMQGITDRDDGVGLSETDLARLVGRYSLSQCAGTPPGFTPPQEVGVELYGGDLIAMVPGQVFIVLTPVTPTRFLSAEDESDWVELELDGDKVKSATFVLDGTARMVYVPKE